MYLLIKNNQNIIFEKDSLFVHFGKTSKILPLQYNFTKLLLHGLYAAIQFKDFAGMQYFVYNWVVIL